MLNRSETWISIVKKNITLLYFGLCDIVFNGSKVVGQGQKAHVTILNDSGTRSTFISNLELIIAQYSKRV